MFFSHFKVHCANAYIYRSRDAVVCVVMLYHSITLLEQFFFFARVFVFKFSVACVVYDLLKLFFPPHLQE